MGGYFRVIVRGKSQLMKGAHLGHDQRVLFRMSCSTAMALLQNATYFGPPPKQPEPSVVLDSSNVKGRQHGEEGVDECP